VPPQQTVHLWLGANVMVEYPIGDARALLGHNLEDGAIPKTSAAIVVLTLAALLLSKLASRKYRALPDVSPRMMAVTIGPGISSSRSRITKGGRC